MGIAQSFPVPLFDENSLSLQGDFFHVFPGEVAQIQAFGFADWKSREDSSTRQVPQVACLEMILFKEVVIPDNTDGDCTHIYSLDRFKSAVLAIETVRRNGCTFSVSKCDNMLLLNLPGSYRFVMNDLSALGTARIYFRVFNKDSFPWNSKFLIGN